MERIRALTRLVMMMAALTCICTYVPQWYVRSDSDKAYAQLDEHMQAIHEEINEGQAYERFMDEQLFDQDLSSQELSAYVDQWVSNEMKLHAYSQETQDAVKKEIAALYESQKALAQDHVYDHYVWIVRGTAITLLVLSIDIIVLLRKKERLSQSKKASQYEIHYRFTK